MDPKYQELLQQYIDQGYSPTTAAIKVRRSQQDFNGDFNSLVREAENFEYLKKKELAESQEQDASGVGLDPTERALSTRRLVSTESESSPIVASEKTKAPSIDQKLAIANNYKERLSKDTAEFLRGIVKEDPSIEANLMRIEAADESEKWKQNERNKLYGDRLRKKVKELQEGYADEINAQLGDVYEGGFLGVGSSYKENLSEYLYKQHGLLIPLDGDQRYNESDYGGLVGWARDMFFNTSASFVDFSSGAISSLGGAILDASTEGDDYDAGVAFVDEWMSTQADMLRAQSTHYENSVADSFAEGRVGELFARGSVGLSESIPYMIGISTPIGLFAQSVNAANNTLIDSYREDANRVKDGIAPVYSDDLAGNSARLVASAFDGILTGYSSRFEALIATGAFKSIMNKGSDAAAEGVRGWFRSRGVNIAAEEAIEITQTLSEMGFQDVLGSEDFTGQQYGEAVLETALQTLITVGSPTVVEVGAIGVRAGKDQIINMLNSSEAALNSPAEKGRTASAGATSDLNVSADFDGMISTFEGDMSQDKESRRPMYNMLAVRHPQVMNKVGEIDRQLMVAVQGYKKSKASEEGKAGLDAKKARIMDLVRQREELIRPYETESTDLNADEMQLMSEAEVANSMRSVDMSVKMASQALEDAGKDLGGTPLNLVDGARYQQLSDEVSESKAKQSQARKLLGEYEQAKKSGNAETQARSLEKLRNLLGLYPEAVKPKEQKAEPSVYDAEKQLEAHNLDPENKGSTFTPDGRNLIGQKKVSVSIFPERTKIIEGDVTKEDLDQYKESNKDLLEKNDDVLAIGTWFDSGSNQTYLDVSAAVAKQPGRLLGKQYNQKSVFDLETKETIDTGGTGEAIEGLKPEVDRVADIRAILGKETTDNVEQAPAEDTNQESKEQAKKAKLRGIEGQFKEVRSKKDGSVTVTPNKFMPARVARFINGRLMPTMKASFGSQGYKIIEHYTAESGDMADGVGNASHAAYAVDNARGPHEIHLNLPRLQELADTKSKTMEAVIVEEVYHLLLSRNLENAAKTNPKAIDSLLNDMIKIAKKQGDEGLVERVQAKMDAYRGVVDKDGNRVFSETAVKDEGIAEIVAEVIAFKSENESVAQKILNDVRVAINKFMRNVVGRDALVIDNISSAEQILGAFQEMVQSGRAIKVDTTPDVDSTVERAAMSPSKLPENESFTLIYSRGGFDSVGGDLPVVPEIKTFSGKWHFINWWNQQKKPLSRVRYSNFRFYDAQTQEAGEAINADVMHSWNLKPPRDKKAEARARYRQKQETIRVSLGGLMDRGSDYSESVNSLFEAVLEVADPESKEVFSEALKDVDIRDRSRAQRDYMERRVPAAVLNDAVNKIDQDAKSDGDGVVERAYAMTVLDIKKEGKTQEDFKKMQDNRAKAICGVGSGTCATNDRTTLLQFVSSQLANSLSENPSFEESVDWAVTNLNFTRDYMTNMEGLDPTQTAQQYEEGKKAMFDKLRQDPEVKVDPSNFDGVFALLTSYFSNGSVLDPNLHLASQMFRAGLIRMGSGPAGGAQPNAFISPRRVRDIQTGEADSFLPSVRGQRRRAVGSHLADINALIGKYTKGGKFDNESFLADARIRDDKGVPALASMVGKNSWKMAELTLGLLGDPKAIPMDTHMRDTFNLARGKYEGTNYVSEDAVLVIPQDVRLAAIEKMKANGYDANPMMSDAQLFEITSKMKASGNESTIARGREVYSSLVGNVTGELREMSAKDIQEARQFVSAVAKKMGVTPFQAQQLMYMNGVYAWSSFQNKPFVSDYNSGLRRAANQNLSTISEDGVTGTQMELNFAQEADQQSVIEMPVPGKKFLSALSGVTQAEQNQLFRSRSADMGTSLKIKGEQVKLNDDVVAEALSTDATSKRIMAKGVEVKPGRKVGVRLNLNVFKNTGVPVQTLHDKTASGEALQYAGAVTVKNATLYVNPEARKKIATFQENKFPMASVNGEFVSNDMQAVSYDGVKATFNPFLQGSFIDAAGRPIKSADEATIVGSNVYLRGKIEYFDAADPLFKKAAKETQANKEKRTERGPKYDQAVKRFTAYSDKALGITFDTQEQAEAAYDAMDIENQTALTDSEVAENAERAVERAAIDNYLKPKMRQGARRIGSAFNEVLDVRAQINANPSNYITPQKLKDLKQDVRDLTDAELINLVSDTQLGALSQQNNNLAVLAQAEILSRAIARGETDAIPGIVAELASIGTTAGRLLRHLREVKGSTPKGMAAFIRAAVEEKGNSLTAEQEKKLEDLTSRMYEAHAIAEDLMTRAANGEAVGAELKDAEKRLKAIEREMDTFTNVVIERGWGELLGQLAQGNVLTTMSQVTNLGANAYNAFVVIGTELAAAPNKWMGQALARLAGKELNFDKQQSLSAHLYAMSRMGDVAAQTKSEVLTGQKQGVTEWTLSRSLMPFRSLIAAFKGELPEKSSKLAAMNQRSKLFVQGTLGIPAEIMFRFLTLGDTPFRKYFENKSLYEQATKLGLEGDALTDFLKHPPKEYQQRAEADGRRITFQEETTASRATQRIITGAENTLAAALSPIKGIDGQQFSKFLFRLLIPFRSTPANILYETATYASPAVGALRMAGNIQKGNYDEAVHTLGKVIVGAAITETALLLMSEGIISGMPEWDEDEEKNLAYDQFPPATVNVSALKRLINGEDPSKQPDDVFAGYMKLGTPGALMAATVRAYVPEDMKEREYSGPVAFANYAIRDMFGVGPLAAAGSMLQQSFLQGMNDFIQLLASGEYEQKSEALLKGIMNVGLSIPLPNQMSALYRAQREYLPDRRVTKDMSTTERIMKNIEYTIKDRTFNGAEIPIRHDWKGQPIKQNPRGNVGWMYQLFDITKIRQGEADAVSQEIYRLFEQTQEISKVVSTPSFAKKRKVSVPNVKTRKERAALRREYGKTYTFLDDKEFTDGGVYFNTEQLNRLMAIAGQERYKEAEALINSTNYRNMSDEERLEALNEINDNYSSVKEYDGGRFKKHTIAILDIMQKIYEDERREED